jgi:predicted negative regulator of RcsB-dependent stress response
VRRISFLAFLLLAVVCFAGAALHAAPADTIVLKNGRRIVAVNVVEEGDHVRYETDAGVLSLPKSIVARIDRDAMIPQSNSGWQPAVAAPQANPAEGFAEIAKAAVRDGSIDFSYLASLENAANGGDRRAVAKVSAAHHVAAQFLASKGDLEGAVDHYRRALTFAPDQLGLLVNLADLQLRRSEFTAALDTLDHARRVAPSSADVAKLSGWGYYSTNRLEQAVAEWKLAVELRPDPDVQRALEKAQRDREAETDYREGRTQHFTLKYYGGAAPELAREVLQTLEEHFRAIESVLGFSPPDSVSVILYTDQVFADITRAPGWAGAINDGRIRVPVKGLTNVTPDFSRILKHELTHTFIQQKTRGRCPVWLQEGTAQWMEGQRSGNAAAGLVSAYQRKEYMPLAALEGSWLNFSGQSASFAYAWSLAAVESIVAAGGESDLDKLLIELPNVPSTEAALREALHTDYADVEERAVNYLRRQYLR